MKVVKLEVGPLMANCYLVWAEDQGSGAGGQGSGTSSCLVIDPGAEPETIIAATQDLKEVLSRNRGKINASASEAGIGTRQLNKLMHKYKLDKGIFK